MPPGVLLQKALRNNSIKKNEVSPHYERFLHGRKYLEKKGWLSLSDGSCSLNVVSFKFMFSFPREKHSFEQSNEATSKPTVESRREHITDHSNVEKELVDGSLVNIFRFYCKLQPPGSKLGAKPSFGDISEANHSLSYLGVVTFLRDFEVIPTIALAEDLGELWKAQTVARNRMLGHSEAKHAAVKGSIAFLEFLEFLCKVALLAYPTDSRSVAVGKLARFLRLEDDARVRHTISIRGAQSCSRINEPHAVDGQGRITSQLLLKESNAKHVAMKGKSQQVPIVRQGAEDGVVPQDTVRFDMNLRDTVEWRRRYGELVREQAIVPTRDFDMSSLQLGASVETVLAHYDSQLIEELQDFVFAVRRSWAAIHVPALDLGSLRLGCIHTVQVMVKNSHSESIAISPPKVVGKELDDMTDFTLEAATTVYPGLCFNFLMEVCPVVYKAGVLEVFGCVELDVIVGKASKKSSKLTLPVYFQMKPA